MRTALFCFRGSWLALLLAGLVSLGLAACQKDEEDTTDYAARDETTIQAYITDNKLTGFQRQASGLYVAITQPGTGDAAKKDQTVSAKYTGSFLNGTIFDSNAATLGALDFKVGQGQVIRGWDEGFMLLNKGSKAIFLIPSGLAYGREGRGPIGPNTVLRFDVEVKDIK